MYPTSDSPSAADDKGDPDEDCPLSDPLLATLEANDHPESLARWAALLLKVYPEAYRDRPPATGEPLRGTDVAQRVKILFERAQRKESLWGPNDEHFDQAPIGVTRAGIENHGNGTQKRGDLAHTVAVEKTTRKQLKRG